MDQIAVDTPPGLRQGGEFGQLSEEENAEQRSAQSRNNNNINNNNSRTQDNEQDATTRTTEEPVNEHGYDKLRSKHSDSSCLVFINSNGIPKTSSDIMNQSLLAAINKTEADIVGIVEHNCNFK